MRIASIGDIHGRPFWKELDHKNYDKIIFTGDYVDSYYINTEDILKNLEEIVEFKNTHPEKIVLLLGNHDIPYRYTYNEYPCSGFRHEMYDAYHQLFVLNPEWFLAAFQYKNYIWSHAGISQHWYNRLKETIEGKMLEHSTNIAGALNAMLKVDTERDTLFWCSKVRGGYDPNGGIVWADRRETKDWYLDDYHQVVGHTPIDKITRYGDEEGSITYADVLGRVAEIREKQEEEIEKWGTPSDENIYIEPTKFFEIVL